MDEKEREREVWNGEARKRKDERKNWFVCADKIEYGNGVECPEKVKYKGEQSGKDEQDKPRRIVSDENEIKIGCQT